MAYPAMLTFLPAGLLGAMVAGLLAAYISTISTHLNWGTSYLVHDLYRRFLRPDASEVHYVRAGRLVTALLMLAAVAFTPFIGTARAGFDLLLSIGAGTGLLYLLRWYWWRINAWAEIAAMASSFALALAVFAAGRAGLQWPTPFVLVVTVVITTVIWLTVAWTTARTDRPVLHAFYRRVRPAGPGWAQIRRECDGLPPADDLGRAFRGVLGGCACVYGVLFGTGHLLMGHTASGAISAVVALVGAALLGSALTAAATRSGGSD
jgi:hypothetical protein